MSTLVCLFISALINWRLLDLSTTVNVVRGWKWTTAGRHGTWDVLTMVC